MFSELDDMKGLSENIIMGQLAPTGTGAFSLMLDESMLQDACEVCHVFIGLTGIGQNMQ